LADKNASLRLGSRVCFEDRWQGRVSGLEVDEDWNVFNISVTSGFLFASSSIRLPFTSVSSWSDDSVRIAANSFKAFGRQIPPVAAPARPLTSGTPVSSPGAKFAGLVIREHDRRAVEVILSRGVGGLYRVPLEDVSFTGKTMTIAVQPEQLVRYYPDAAISEELHRLIAEDPALTTDDKRHIQADVENGVVTVSGNVRVRQTHDYMDARAVSAPGVVSVRNELHVDFEIETAIGFALNAAGASPLGKAYVRSNLGEVQIDGTVPTERAAEDVVRIVARVPGVHSVINRLQVRSAAAAGAR
jgi:osmotically-inducible protein OsmY